MSHPLAAIALAYLVLTASDAVADSCSDLSLVLAIDSSGSIVPEEYALQIAGYAAAFVDSGIQRALAAAGNVDVAVVFWGDVEFGFQKLPWHRIRSAVDANAVAANILAAPRQVYGGTNIGAGLSAALDMLDMPNRCTRRAIVNVSGDGRESQPLPRARRTPVPLPVARARAVDLGVTVNGLAITRDAPDLSDYYRDNLIAGEGAFVMQVDNFNDFSDAIRRKLQREIGFVLSAQLER